MVTGHRKNISSLSLSHMGKDTASYIELCSYPKEARRVYRRTSCGNRGNSPNRSPIQWCC